MTEEYKPTNRQRISGLEGRIEAQQTSIRRLFEEVNRLKVTALDHGQRFYRYGELEAQLITRMDALENPPDVKEPEDAPERDFPCCDRGEHVATAADIGERFEVDASNVTRFITKLWCPYTGKTNVVTVHFKTGAPPICLACGFNH